MLLHDIVLQGKFKNKDSLIGVNKDEGTYWILYALPGFSKDDESLHTYQMFLDGVDLIDWDLSETQKVCVGGMQSRWPLK